MTFLPHQHSIRLTALTGFSLALALSACSGSSSPGEGNGGSPAGGAVVEGGSTSSAGGTVATGGSTASPATGGTLATGGSVQPSGGSTGGTRETGGSPSSGGFPATGGSTASGGSKPTGGTPGTGGVAGGTITTGGGTTASGGKVGGATATGGATGGTVTSGGGTTASGGKTGGATASGGTPGGTTATGGSTGAGGTTAVGGSNTALQDLVKAMSPGWNLGNSFDGAPQVTSWGNPAPNQTLIKAVKAAGFNSIRIPVTWTDHIGAAPNYTIDATWMASVVQTGQWAVDAGLYAFVNTHHDADGQWVTFPADPTTVTAEVTAVWKQIATAFQAVDSKLMFECFNEPHSANGGTSAGADLNLYLAACVNAIRGTGGANTTRVVMIQPIGASPVQSGIQTMLKATIINDPNLIISLHTYYPTNFGLGNSAVAWGSAADYTSMSNSITQIRGWLPNWAIVIGEWGSQSVDAITDRAAHALAYSQDTSTAGMCPMWWDNGGSYKIFDRTTGAETQPTIVSGIVKGAQQGLAAPNTFATLANP